VGQLIERKLEEALGVDGGEIPEAVGLYTAEALEEGLRTEFQGSKGLA